MELSASKAVEIRVRNCPVLVLSRPTEYRVIPLDGGLISIGSDVLCDLTLEHDSLEERHAVVQPTENGFEIFNLSGSGDLLRNGRRIEAAELVQGDEIRLGHAFFTYIDPNADIMPAGFQLLSLPLEFLRSQAIVEAQMERTKSDETFNDILVDALKRSPWILISGAIHAAIYVVLLSFMPAPVDSAPPPKLEVDMAEADEMDDAPIDEFDVDEVEPVEEEIEEPPEFADEIDESPFTDDAEADSLDSARETEMLQGIGSFRMGSGTDRGIGGNGIGIPGGAGENVTRRIRNLQESGLEVVVLLDATGSMDAEIEAAKNQIVKLLASLQALGIEFRLGVVAFRDKGESYVTRSSPLTRHIYKSVAFLDGLSAVGGGDEPEALYDAFKDATRMRFASRAEKVLILVGDAPPKPQTTRPLLKLVDGFAKRGGHVHTIYTNSDPNNRDWSGTRKTFAAIAEAGAGSAVKLAQEKQLVTDIVRLTLAAETSAEASMLLSRIESGPRAERIRSKVRKLDASFVEKCLTLPVLDPQIPLEILKHNHENFLECYFRVLDRRSLPRANRWLTCVLLRRLLRQIDAYHGIGADANRLLEQYDPEDSFMKQQTILTRLKKQLYDDGLLKLKKNARKR